MTARRDGETGRLTRTTAWARGLGTPLRDYLRTETGGAAVLLGAAVAALVWANADLHSYTRVWSTELSIRLGGWTLAASLRHWVNDGLMAIFFLVVGLEARRELDLGELRERRRLLLPAAAALGGMAAAVATFLAVNAGSGARGGWGVALSTDTAFAIGILALVGPPLSGRMRALLVTLLVVDDLVALGVIAVAYSTALAWVALLVAGALLAAVLVARAAGVRRGWVYALLGIALWVAVWRSGIDPVIVGLLMGLLTVARPAARVDLEEATDRFRDFREQPTAELAQAARASVEQALSPNERLQHRFHPWSSYAIVPLFALANAGIAARRRLPRRRAPLPGDARDRRRLRARQAARRAGGDSARAADGPRRAVAADRLGRAWRHGRRGGRRLHGRAADRRPRVRRRAAARGDARRAAERAARAARLVRRLPCDRAAAAPPPSAPARRRRGHAGGPRGAGRPGRDHVRGPEDASVTLVEYGDFECPYCGQAEPIVRELLAGDGDLRYVWRHLPLPDVHPRAEVAAEAVEAAAEQGAFWEYHALLFAHQDALAPKQLVQHAEQLGFDVERFRRELRDGIYGGRVARDVESADLSASPARPPSSSTARATTAPTTSRR